MTLQSNWEKTLEMLRQDLSKTVYEAWFESLKATSIDEKQNILHVETDNEFIYNTIEDRYKPLLQGAVEYIFQNQYNVALELAETKPSPKPESVDGSSADNDLVEEYYLNPRFNFDSFVVGPNNEFAYSAALAVAESPAKQYNPLFLYGGSGLGKTHLMHAIGHYILNNFDNKKILYVSSEMFTNELINALRDKEIGSFKKKYRNIDVLLIDDIQFIEGKDRTQEEFFHTFNALYDRNKQIIISSDRPPQKLTSLDERLTSRFLWSVSADIQPPDYETRVAILMNKATAENIEITEDVKDVISLIAEKIKMNVRELEGAFTRIISFSTLLKKPINTVLAKEILKDMISSSEMKISINGIKKTVSKYYGISIKDMDSAKRNRNISFPRQIAMYLSKELTDNSLPKIGEAFGGRDHTTVLHAHKKISGEMTENESLKNDIIDLKAIINEK
ncbi:MAG: chromosomal replication initiator protein DnaA [Eubacteriaceae bacterium]|nr:chromosomal replication initiator protein DnaA [Eubacteriaceae bacterium]